MSFREPAPNDRQPSSRHDDSATSKTRVLESTELFPPGTAEIRLRHGDEEYRLRITRQGKLILTK